MKQLSIAVIGSGIAGLSAAWLLSKSHAVTVFEAADYTGGHCNTIDVNWESGLKAVDTGFIIYNPPNYPNLSALFDHLNVPTKPSRMTFAFSANDGAYEYSGTRLGGLFGQPANIVNPAHWQMLFDLLRFFRSAESIATDMADDLTLGEFLEIGGYSRGFIDNHLLPMASAIWSASPVDIAGYPMRSFVRFFANHGLLQAFGRPEWRTVDGGAREYVGRLIEDGAFQIELNCRVRKVRRRQDMVVVQDHAGILRTFDHAVLATHADQALGLLSDPTDDEAEHLGQFDYSKNLAIVHTDPSQMPRRKQIWSSWNYIQSQKAANVPTVTYWMNSLQNLGTEKDIFVTLNPTRPIRSGCEIARFDYDHPLYSSAALRAQRQLWNLQGRCRTWFCGSYFGAGFHEDALQSGLAVAEQLGGLRRPWLVNKASGRIVVQACGDEYGIAAE